MSRDERRHWNEKYSAGIAEGDPIELRVSGPPARVLAWAPRAAGKDSWALDLGCGLGRNSVALRHLGYRVLAVDTAIRGLQSPLLAAEGISRLLADLDQWRPEKSRFELICDVHYLNRPLAPILAEALKPGGALMLEIRVAEANRGRGEDRPHPFRLAPEEAKTLFPELRCLRENEEMDHGLGTARYHLEAPR